MDIRTGIVGIKSDPKSQNILGTGFFVPGGLILTCAHVFEAYPSLQPYCQLEGGTACFETEVVFSSPKTEYDLLILRPLAGAPHTPLPVTTSLNSKGHAFSIFGYPAIAFEGLNGAGTIMGWTREKGKAFEVLQLDSDQVTHGFSGAPVWDETLNVVVGMLQQGIKQEEIGRPSFALPIEVIQSLYPDLQVGLPTPGGGLPPGSYLPFPRNTLFTGRKKELENLEKALCSPLLVGEGPGVRSIVITQAVTGMGGIGKTQLAVEFAYRCGQHFRGVHWLDLRDPDALDAAIALCGTKMGLAYDKQPEQVAHTLHTWTTDGPRLLILDNFEEIAKTNAVLSRFQHPSLRLLLTSRRTDFPRSAGLESHALDTFTEPESLEFLAKTLDSAESEANRKALAEKLGHLPLALELAAGYINVNQLPIPNYLQELEDILAHESMQEEWFEELEIANPTSHEQSLLATFQLSWRQVTDETAQKAFMLAGYCAPNTPIPTEIFAQALEIEDKTLTKALYRLNALGLLSAAEGFPTIHPLLANFARISDPENQQLDKVAGTVFSLAAAANKSGLPKQMQPYQQHARTCGEFAEKAGLEIAGSLWNEFGYSLSQIADYAGAKAAYERALRIDEAAFGPEHPNVARDVNNLGLVLKDLGDLQGAKAAYERALKIFEHHLGENHPNVATLVNNLGSVLRALGDLQGARAAFERALKIWESSLGENHPQVAIGVNNLGSVLQALGDLEGARAACERALRIDEAAFGPEHPKIAIRVNNLGSVLQDLGDLAGAKAAFEQALKIDEAAFGPEHPSVARDVNNLGSVLKALGDLQGAKAAFERALKIWEAGLGESHPQVAAGVNNLGGVLKDLGDLEGAKAACERVLKIDEAAFGLEHPSVARDVNNLGSVLQDLGDLDGARAAYEQALKIFRQFLPEGHPNIKIVEGNLRRLGE